MMGMTSPQEGGSERHIYELASRIENATVLAQRGSICPRKVELPILNWSNFVRNISFLISAFIFTIYLSLNPRKKYDLIHIHENLLYFLIPILKLRYNVVVTVHGINGFGFYDNKYLWIIFRSMLKFADVLIAVNLEDKKKIERIFRKVVYFPNGVDLSYFENLKVKTEKKIAFIGRVHEQKGIIYLLEAFSKIEKKNQGFKLEIIGEVNDYARELQKKFPSKNIVWLGYMSDRNKISRILASAYCIVMPSLWEGLPLVLFEALASKRPVITSDIPAYKSVLDDEVLFCKVENSVDLAEKIGFLVKNKKKSDDLGKKGAKLAIRYDWNSISANLKRFYSTFL